MRRILIISFSKIDSDPRVRRQLTLLKEKFNLMVTGFGRLHMAGVSMATLPEDDRSLSCKIPKALQLLTGAFSLHYWSRPAVVDVSEKFSTETFDLVLANDVEALPVALKIAKGAPVILDAHEYSPREMEGWKWRLFFQRYKSWLCQKYLMRANAVCTVSRGIAVEYERNYGVRCSIVMNAADYQNLRPSKVLDDQVRLIHHGGINRSRQIELMIDLMDALEHRFTLDLMLVNTDPQYFEELRRRASHNHRIRFVDPVSLHEIPAVLNRYDIGVYLLPFSNFNNMHALPNKFFEFVQGRLGVAIGPSPEMARLVKEYELGLIANDFHPVTLAKLLNELTTEQIRNFKRNADRAARSLSSQESGEELLRMIDDALKNIAS
ncbi:MAG: glycosyltransferase [Nitrosomonas sp.]|nr:glycosyltransferase [Nitrosomonas sp.]